MEKNCRIEAEDLFHKHLLQLLQEFEQLREVQSGRVRCLDQGFEHELSAKPGAETESPPESLSGEIPKEAEPLPWQDAEVEGTSEVEPLQSLPELVQKLYMRLAADTTGTIPWSVCQSFLEWKGKHNFELLKGAVQLLSKQVGQTISPRSSMASKPGCLEIEELYIDYACFAELMRGNFDTFAGTARDELLELRNWLQEEAHTANFTSFVTLSKTEQKSKSCWSFFEAIPQAVLLEMVPAFVIMVNAVVIGVSLDNNSTATYWQVLEVIFTVLFSLEALLRMRLMGCTTYFVGADAGWNYFDLICLACAYTDISLTMLFQLSQDDSTSGLDGIMLIKVLRLGRVCRLIRVMRFGAVRELRVIILGVLSGVRVLFWAIALLFFTVFLMGVSLRILFDSKEPEFTDVPSAMFTAFRCVTDGCSDYLGAPLHERLRRVYGDVVIPIYMVLFLFVVIGIFNLIMAVFLDSVLNDHEARELQELGYKSAEMEQHISQVIATLVRGDRVKTEPEKPKSLWRWIGSFSGRTSSKTHEIGSMVHRQMNMKVEVAREDFNQWLEYPEMIQMLSHCKIEHLGKGRRTATKYDLFDVLDAEMVDKLHFNELVDGLMRLRGPITKVDVIALRLKMRHLVRLVHQVSQASKVA
ncbi:unnamed protein product [Durusdinium trenchii]|uniref:Ion transport domain-containing protein n=1 Tax=Durusdinium trenchii TaxID=1381693 RepID=A0ABP0JME6_9DINO